MDTVRETVEECSGEPLRAEDFGPLVEGKVGRDQYGATLVALAEDLEEQLGSGLGQGHSHRANSNTRGLLREGMARKSKVSSMKARLP